MKRILTYIWMAIAATAVLASCDKNLPPKFDDKDAFVAFDDVTVTVSEDYTAKNGDATVKVPVTLASVAGLDATIKFTIAEPEAKAAKAGVNYELVTTSGTLSFNAQDRTQYIEFKTLADGQYTGDLTFDIVLSGTETLAVGSESVCTVKITDVDHPLGFMLGAYTASGDNYWDGPVTWKMTFYKDEKDEHKVWIENLFQVDNWANSKTRYYGVVNDDATILNIPFGQNTEYKYSNGNPVQLLGFDGENGYDSGSVDVAITRDGDAVTLDFGTEWGFWAYIKGAGNLNIVNPGIKAVKN